MWLQEHHGDLYLNTHMNILFHLDQGFVIGASAYAGSVAFVFVLTHVFPSSQGSVYLFAKGRRRPDRPPRVDQLVQGALARAVLERARLPSPDAPLGLPEESHRHIGDPPRHALFAHLLAPRHPVDPTPTNRRWRPRQDRVSANYIVKKKVQKKMAKKTRKTHDKTEKQLVHTTKRDHNFGTLPIYTGVALMANTMVSGRALPQSCSCVTNGVSMAAPLRVTDDT